MEVFDAFGRAIKAVVNDRKIWRLPVILGAVASALEYTGGDMLPIAIVATALRVPLIYYPTKAYQLRFYGRAIDEGELLWESIIGGLKTLLVGILYGIIVAVIGLAMLIPAIIAYTLLPKPLGLYVAVALGILPVVFALGLMYIMIPAYIWTERLEEGTNIIGEAWKKKKETVLFGLIVLLFASGVGVLYSTIEAVALLIGLPAALVGLIGGAVSELGNAVINISGAEMFLRLRPAPVQPSPPRSEFSPRQA